MAAVRKVGVEEEQLLVDPETGGLANAAGRVLHERRSERRDTPPPSASTDLEGEHSCTPVRPRTLCDAVADPLQRTVDSTTD